MPLEFEIVNEFKAENVWTRVAPHPERMKLGLPRHWRFHVEGRDKIFLIDNFVTEISPEQDARGSVYSQDDTASTTGMTAWIRAYGDAIISTDRSGLITAKVKLKSPQTNSW